MTDRPPAAAARPLPTLAYSIAQLCIAASVSRSTVYSEVAAGRLRIAKIGRRSVILAAEADRWLAALAGGDASA